jgi:hypothetical protein
LLIGLAGCGGETDQLPREAISGSVTFDGQPLKNGYIQFLPDAASDDATFAGGPIREGKFDIPREQGPTPGRYSVTVISGEAAPSEASAAELPGAGFSKKEKIPAKYNSRTTLTAEVKKGGPNQFEFPLKTK